MSEQQVPVKRTVVTMREFVRAVMKSWRHVDDGPCTKGACAVLWSQHAIETGGGACWGWNLGNVKHVTGDGSDYHCLRGVWEGVTEVTAANLIASGHASRDPSPDHAKAVGPGKVSVLFEPPHPATRFRAFPSLEVAMAEHLKFLAHRYSPAWLWVIAGDYRAFATTLHAHGYFTASADAYASGMRRAYEEAMASGAWDEMRDAMDQDQIDTQPEVPVVNTPLPMVNTPIMENAASSPTIHASPSEYLQNGPPDDPKDAA